MLLSSVVSRLCRCAPSICPFSGDSVVQESAHPADAAIEGADAQLFGVIDAPMLSKYWDIVIDLIAGNSHF